MLDKLTVNILRRLAVKSVSTVVFTCFFSLAHAEPVINGSSIYTDLGKDQFIASLYLDTPSTTPSDILSVEGEKRMEIRMLNNYSQRRWFNLWMQSISINNDKKTFTKAADQLVAMMQAPKSAPRKGDLIEYAYTPSAGTAMTFNNTQLVSGASKAVFDLLLRTWIGPIPPATQFKEQILGKEVNSLAGELLDTVNPTPERVALAKSWVVAAQDKEAAPKDTPDNVKTYTTKKPPTEPTPATTKAEAKIASTDKSKLPEKKAVPNSTAASTVITTASLGLTSAEETPNIAPSTAVLTPSDITVKIHEGPIELELTLDEEPIEFDIKEALAHQEYSPIVIKQIYRSLSYPRTAIRLNQQGTVRIMVIIRRSGELEEVITTHASRHNLLNKATLAAVNKAAPFPPIPDEIKSETLEITVPVTFRLD